MRDLPRSAYSRVTSARIAPSRPAIAATAPSHIHPVLRRWLADSLGSTRKELLVTFRDRVEIPRFPEPDAAARGKSGALDAARALIDRIAAARDSQYRADEADLGRRFEARVLERFWLVQAMRVEMPLRAVENLAARHDVLYVEPRNAGEPPPWGGPPTPNSGDEVIVGRHRIGSDPYFDLGVPSVPMSLLDTGVFFGHELLTPPPDEPSHIGIKGDCVNGLADCITQDPEKPAMNAEDTCADAHGTASAAIITGGVANGGRYRGVTRNTLDCFRVYEGCPPTYVSTAGLHGMQDAVSNLRRVICAEIQTDSTDLCAISIAADHAFDSGAAVIAPNGNKHLGADGSTYRTVTAPAYARKVIGVGAYDFGFTSGEPITAQNWGPTADNRVKPDVMGPTNTETADNGGPGLYFSFTGTSGAAPYVAGAAALLRGWLKNAAGVRDPGYVYAQLILAGRKTSPFDPKMGAGGIVLRPPGQLHFGKISLIDGEQVDIPVSIGGIGQFHVEAAAWWPERLEVDEQGNRVDTHNVIELRLLDKDQNLVYADVQHDGVFKRDDINLVAHPGNVLWVRARMVGNGEAQQTVYWAVAVRGP